MSDTVTLKHVVNRQPVREIYFYDGHEVARNGLITIPLDLEWRIKRVWLLGYNLAPDDTPLWTWSQVQDEIKRQTAESAKEVNESSNRRRQPATEDRLRTSQR